MKEGRLPERGLTEAPGPRGAGGDEGRRERGRRRARNGIPRERRGGATAQTSEGSGEIRRMPVNFSA